MKRLWVSVMLLAAAVCTGACTAVYIHHASRHMLQLCGNICDEARQGGDTEDEVRELCEYWDSCCEVLAFVENSGCVISITAEVARLPAMTKGDTSELIQQTDSIRAQCGMLAKRQLPHICSIL